MSAEQPQVPIQQAQDQQQIQQIQHQQQVQQQQVQQQQVQQQQQQQPEGQIVPNASVPEGPAPADALQGGREINQKVVHVSNIVQSVTEDDLKELFKVAGNVVSAKVLPDKNNPGLNYAFVEYEGPNSVDLAIRSLQGHLLANLEINIKNAYHSLQAIKDVDTFNLFVGDLASEVNDEALSAAFSNYPSFIEAHVMWDMSTGRSRGYGFATFKDKADAERAVNVMNGEWIGNRPIKLNWASQRNDNNSFKNNGYQNNYYNQQNNQGRYNNQGRNNYQNKYQNNQKYNNKMNNAMPIPPTGLTYEYVIQQTANWQTTVYIGNLAPFTSSNDLIPILQNFGYIVDFKHQPERGYAFVKYDSHERAAMAIVQLSGYQIGGRSLKCGWGKETNNRPNNLPYQNFAR